MITITPGDGARVLLSQRAGGRPSPVAADAVAA